MYKQFGISIIVLTGCLVLFGGCATLPKDFDKPVSYAFEDTDDTMLAGYQQSEKEAHGGKSGFYLLGSGLDAFAARAILVSKAEKSIDLQYFLYHSDLVAKLLTDQLIKAADRGVRVRILLDDIDMGDRDRVAVTLDSHPNIEVRLLNPFVRNRSRILQFVTRYGSATRRMHNKSFTVDNQASILGGRNIGDEYFEANHDFSFADLDVLCIGPVVKDVSREFDLYWNCELAYPVSALTKIKPTVEGYQETTTALTQFVEEHADSPYLEELRNSDFAQKAKSGRLEFEWGMYDVMYDKPEKLLMKKSERELHISTLLEPYIRNLKKEVILCSPYFVPSKRFVDGLVALRESGVRVRILTNSLASTNHAIVHTGYSKVRKKLLRAGVEIYELNKILSKEEKENSPSFSKAGLHAKSFIFDRDKMFVGSLNLDPMALYNNTEMGVIITQEEMAGKALDWFDNNIDKMAFRVELVKNENGGEKLQWLGYENGKEVIFTKEPYTGFWKRFGIGFMKIFPINSFL